MCPGIFGLDQGPVTLMIEHFRVGAYLASENALYRRGPLWSGLSRRPADNKVVSTGGDVLEIRVIR
jgi:hypothetical protein